VSCVAAAAARDNGSRPSPVNLIARLLMRPKALVARLMSAH